MQLIVNNQFMFFKSKIEIFPSWLNNNTYSPYYLNFVVRLRYDESIFYFTGSS